MPKISIYVPDDLKARMDTVGDRANWSAITQRAFNIELNHFESIKEVKTMENVIERLSVSKQKFVEIQNTMGRKNGVTWAKKHAEYNELRRMYAMEQDPLDAMYGFEAMAYVWRSIHGEQPEAFNVREMFMLEEETDIDLISGDYVEAFIEGATDIWSEVVDSLE